MQIQRVPPLLQGVAEVRNWIVQHIPLSKSMVGYDLFLKIGNDFFSGKPLELNIVFKELPHTVEEIRAQIVAMEQAGLLVEQAGSDGTSVRIVPTQHFVDLIRQYQSKFESLFILRKDLRERQLFCVAPRQKLHQLVETIYDHFHDLGWLYLHEYGAKCFMMASLVRRVAIAYGHKAELQSCHVDVRAGSDGFVIGTPGYAAPGQIEGHAVCLIDDALLVDFGLGSVRRQFRHDFYWGLAAPIIDHDIVIAQVQLPNDKTVTWKSDWQTPDGPAEFAKCEPVVEQLFLSFADRFG